MKMFKTSMRGFKKSDVNSYIIELNNDFADLKVNYELEIADLKLKLKAAEENIDQMSETEALLRESTEINTALKEEIEASNCKISELSEACEKLRAENNEISENLQSITDENSNLILKIKEKSDLIETQSAEIQNKNNKVSEQARRIAELEMKISEISAISSESEEKFNCISQKLAEATSTLTEKEKTLNILTSRKCELEDLLKQVTVKLSIYESERTTDTERELITRKARKADAALNSAAADVTTDVNDAIVESAQSCLNEFQQFADKVQFTSRNAIAELADEYALLASRAAYYCDVLDSSTKKSISEFRGKANSICKDLKKEQ